jgi:WhiB family redox-sensing transcriptional regulator
MLNPDRPKWHTRAACRGTDPELFFPQRGEDTTGATAIAVCATCPVQTECLNYALAADEKFGVWGGMSRRERRLIRRDQRNTGRDSA